MEGSNFIIKSFNNSIILEKDNKKIAISQDNNNDIWFRTAELETTIELKSDYMVWNEWQTFLIFDNLMKLIFGKYFIYDMEHKYNLLPNDFIDLENKTITWHSDNDNGSKITLEHNGNSIKIMLAKEKNDEDFGNFVKIKTSNSKYKNYYQEFLVFFNSLCNLEHSLNNSTTFDQTSTNNDLLIKQKKI